MNEVKSKKTIVIPDGVEVSLYGSLLKIKGPKGENQRLFASPLIKLSKDNSNLNFYVKGKITKKEKRMIGTFASHIKNLVRGVKDGFEYKLKICSGHFPMNVKVENNEVVIRNFLGEKIPRKSRVVSGVNIDIKNELIIVKGIDKEKTAQMAARIEQSTRIVNRDRRRFQDGCYIIEKAGKTI